MANKGRGLRRNSSWSQSKKGGRHQSSVNPNGPKRSVGQGPTQTPPLPPPLQRARYSRRRRANTLGEDEDEREEGEEVARRARKYEMGQADQVATGTA